MVELNISFHVLNVSEYIILSYVKNHKTKKISKIFKNKSFRHIGNFFRYSQFY